MSGYSHTSSSASTTSLVSHQQTRDYSAAFGSLVSSYGSSGAAPCRPSSKTASHLASTGSSSQGSRSPFSRQHAASSTPGGSQTEKYAAHKSQDYGALMDKYDASMSVGFGNGRL